MTDPAQMAESVKTVSSGGPSDAHIVLRGFVPKDSVRILRTLYRELFFHTALWICDCRFDTAHCNSVTAYWTLQELGMALPSPEALHTEEARLQLDKICVAKQVATVYR